MHGESDEVLPSAPSLLGRHSSEPGLRQDRFTAIVLRPLLHRCLRNDSSTEGFLTCWFLSPDAWPEARRAMTRVIGIGGRCGTASNARRSHFGSKMAHPIGFESVIFSFGGQGSSHAQS